VRYRPIRSDSRSLATVGVPTPRAWLFDSKQSTSSTRLAYQSPKYQVLQTHSTQRSRYAYIVSKWC